MTNDEILQAAKDSYLDQLYLKRDGEKHYILDLCYPEIERFATMIEKRTIERCASLAEQGPEQCEWTDEADYDTGLWHGYLSAAAAIRKLGEQE